MSLHAVRVAIPTFQTILNHLQTGSRGYGNMHLREMRQANNAYAIRYLHVMVVRDAAIEGAISGPGVYWRYRLTSQQLTVLVEHAPPKERARIAENFVKEILKRIEQERGSQKHPVNRTKGQFYLRRQRPGSAVSSPASAAALSAGILDRAFLALLQDWALLLYQH